MMHGLTMSITIEEDGGRAKKALPTDVQMCTVGAR